VRFATDEARGVYRAHLTLLGLVKDEAGRPVARITHDWPIEGPLAERDRVRRASTVFRRAMTLPPGRYTLETAVQDRETGALSVERSGFAIAEAPPGGLALGSLSIVRRAEAAIGPDAADPLRVAGVVIHPELGPPQLTRSMPEIPLLPVYPSLAANSPRSLELLRDGQAVAQAPPAAHASPTPVAGISAAPGPGPQPIRDRGHRPPGHVGRGAASRCGRRPGPRWPRPRRLRCRPTSCRSWSRPPATCSTTSRPSTTSRRRSPTPSGPTREEWGRSRSPVPA
jgi:hypothetical protein